ncbi:MAG: Plug domain-containing protein [Flavisolibacter sp.]
MMQIKIIGYRLSKILGLSLFLMISPCLQAQDPMAALRQSVGRYGATHFEESIFLHTDKNYYLAGEIIWFKLYVRDEATRQLSSLSKIGYVDLLDKNNQPVLQAKISLKKFEDNGSFQLPVRLNSGVYKLRAYTSLMKNFGADHFFEEQLLVINTLKSPSVLYPEVESQYQINFFPEGGNLIKGINSKIGFKITDNLGRGISCKGVILKNNLDTIASFQTLKFGMGSFYFQPIEKEGYKAIIILPTGEFIKKDLPIIEDFGYVTDVFGEDSAELNLSIQTNYPDSTVYLLAQQKGQISILEKIPLSLGKAHIIIEKTRLPRGISLLTVFNNNQIPVCQRLVFLKPDPDTALGVSTEKSSYTTREKVKLSFQGVNSSFLPNALSVSVYRMDSLEQTNLLNSTHYFWLTSSLNGFIESPQYYFSDDPDVFLATDNLLLIHGWSRLYWTDKEEQKQKHYPLEYDGHIVSAKLTDPRSGKPAEGINLFLSVPGNLAQFYHGQTNASGIVHFNVKNYYGAGEIIIQPTSAEDSLYKIELITPFYEETSKSWGYIIPPPHAYVSDIENSHIAMQVQNLFSADTINKFYAFSLTDTLPFYGKAPYSYLLDDYTRFTTMEEVLREYVREINVGTRGGTLHIKLFNEINRTFSEKEALVLLDGIALPDVNKIFSVDPLTIKRLDVIPTSYNLGNSLFPGIASFISYNAKDQNVAVNKNAIIMEYEGLQLRRQFFSPVYENSSFKISRMPDFRNTLLWVPDVKLNPKESQFQIEFYSSDMKGIYRVALEGLKNDGRPISSSTSFEVK